MKKLIPVGVIAAIVVPCFFIAMMLTITLGAISAATSGKKDQGGTPGCVPLTVVGGFANPLVGQLTSPYGPRANPFGPGVIPAGFQSEEPLIFHDGSDIAGVPEGTPYYSASAGKVLTVFGAGTIDGPGDGGNGIIIDAGNGVHIWYWHAVNGSAKVKKGDTVSAGQELAATGRSGMATGVHLHFSIQVNGKSVDPVAWLKQKGIALGQGGPTKTIENASTTNQPTAPAHAEKAGFTTKGPDAADMTLNADQMRNAWIIKAEGLKAGATNNDIKIALMVALQESRLRMLSNKGRYPESVNYPNQGDGSDNDSLNFMQQRPATGWGTVAQLMDSSYAARAFFGGQSGPNHGEPPGLLDIPNRQSLPLGEAGQKVQRSAFPLEYEKWASVATAILGNLGGGTAEQCDNVKENGPGPVTNQLEARQALIEAAKKGLGGTYAWGHGEFKNWDCSGYVKWVYAQAGITLPRTEQWSVGSETNDPSPGDLVVQNPDGDNHWAHVGIYAGDGMMYSALNPAEGTLLHPVDWNPGSKYFVLIKG